VRGYRPVSCANIATPAADGGRGMRWEIGTSTHMQPINECTGLPYRWEGPASFHPGGIMSTKADGSTDFISETVDSQLFLSMGAMGDGK